MFAVVVVVVIITVALLMPALAVPIIRNPSGGRPGHHYFNDNGTVKLNLREH